VTGAQLIAVTTMRSGTAKVVRLTLSLLSSGNLERFAAPKGAHFEPLASVSDGRESAFCL
jgi:hypothetical protein